MTEGLAAVLSVLTSTLLSADSSDNPFQDIADVLAGGLPGRPRVGVARFGDDPLVAGSSGLRATLVYESGVADGLCDLREAFVSGRPVSVSDLAAETRWGDYGSRMAARRFRSVETRPLSSNGQPIGALGLYSSQPHAFGGAAADELTVVVQQLDVLLGVLADTARQSRTTEQLRAALVSRSTIDQALGIVMGKCSCNRDAAFEMLRRASNQRNVKLALVASELVASVSGGPSAAGGFADTIEPRRTDPPVD